ncbi:hypothetical protein [Streptomyces cavourensis]|uniref:Uncharacterized protein n=1 Tax=Streptomyces cavourensis TaxID=67258 RepID=A0ABY5FIR8_9ACTN|nr:hypothetical protein [Streptomyces cavourensis]UTR83594.1 hypothetical protein NLU04_34340 [Streptomyces cavourensis]UTR83611.1 hypothetical protein NLU04_34425 [Streptomyces cavourensis]
MPADGPRAGVQQGGHDPVVAVVLQEEHELLLDAGRHQQGALLPHRAG